MYNFFRVMKSSNGKVYGVKYLFDIILVVSFRVLVDMG